MKIKAIQLAVLITLYMSIMLLQPLICNIGSEHIRGYGELWVNKGGLYHGVLEYTVNTTLPYKYYRLIANYTSTTIEINVNASSTRNSKGLSHIVSSSRRGDELKYSEEYMDEATIARRRAFIIEYTGRGQVYTISEFTLNITTKKRTVYLSFMLAYLYLKAKYNFTNSQISIYTNTSESKREYNISIILRKIDINQSILENDDQFVTILSKTLVNILLKDIDIYYLKEVLEQGEYFYREYIRGKDLTITGNSIYSVIVYKNITYTLTIPLANSSLVEVYSYNVSTINTGKGLKTIIDVIGYGLGGSLVESIHSIIRSYLMFNIDYLRVNGEDVVFYIDGEYKNSIIVYPGTDIDAIEVYEATETNSNINGINNYIYYGLLSVLAVLVVYLLYRSRLKLQRSR